MAEIKVSLLKCDIKCCKNEFHTRCAIDLKLIKDWTIMSMNNNKIYCREHSKNKKIDYFKREKEEDRLLNEYFVSNAQNNKNNQISINIGSF